MQSIHTGTIAKKKAAFFLKTEGKTKKRQGPSERKDWNKVYLFVKKHWDKWPSPRIFGPAHFISK